MLQPNIPSSLPPGTHPDGTPMFFELDYQDRETLLAEYANNWGDIDAHCRENGMMKSSYFQQQSPHPREGVNEPQSALASMLNLSGIFLDNDKANGIYSTPFNHLNTPWKRSLAIEGLKRVVTGNLKGADEEIPQAVELVDGGASSGDYALGSTVNPRRYLRLRDASRMVAFPPLSAVAMEVIVQAGQIIIPEFKADAEKGHGPHPWTDGDEIVLDSAFVSDRQVNPKWIAGGFKISDGLWASSIGLSYATIRANRYGVRTERILVKELLRKMDAKKGTAVSVGLTGSSYSSDVLTAITMLFGTEQEDFVITDLFGNTATVRKFLNIDTSDHYANAGPQTMRGTTAATYTYGKMPVDGRIYDLAPGMLETDLTNDKLIGSDRDNTASVMIMEDTSRETPIDLERATAFSYTLRYLTTLNLDDGTPIKYLGA